MSLEVNCRDSLDWAVRGGAFQCFSYVLPGLANDEL
jgi:hypothetical protein